MSVVGIIAEFNPFHSGHDYLLNQARLVAGKDPIIVLMSGNYVQRGQMAIMSKWDRARAALECGADLVLEMPFSTSVEPADLFALGSISALSKVGVQSLVFGVENENLNFNYLGQRIAQIPPNSMEFKDYTQTYSTQYNQMIAGEVGYEINTPNAILGLAYAVANYNLGSPMELHPISRIGVNHDDALMRNGVVQSASAIRNLLIQGDEDTAILEDWLPKREAKKLQKQKVYPNWNLLFPFLKYRLESSTLEELSSIYQMSEGLEHKLKAEIHLSENFSDFLRQIKSKRYTYARLRRLSLYTLLNITQDDILDSFNHESLNILGFSKLGRQYLSENRKNFSEELVSKIDKKNSKDGSIHLNVRVDRLFEQLMGHDQNFGRRPIEV